MTLRTTLAGALATLSLLVIAAPAPAGPPIRTLAPCAGQDASYGGPQDDARVRAAVHCLMNEIRRSQGLPALREDARLRRAAQGHATAQARSGALNHGRSVSEIPRRIARAGYRA